MAKSFVSFAAWVPLPAPGGPKRMRLSSAIGEPDRVPRARKAAQEEYLRTNPSAASGSQEAFVVAHHQLRFQLFHRVERDADHDDDRRAAEVELHAAAGIDDRRQESR